MNRVAWALFATLTIFQSLACGEDLTCLTDKQRETAVLSVELKRLALEALERRQENFESLANVQSIRDRQAQLREFFIKQLGGFPDRTPLNARTVGEIKQDGYRIEKVIYDSRPGHRITANLYLPNGDGAFAGVVVSSGHSRTAKTADYNQRFGIMMAKHGMAALCFDPIGQGERAQILNPAGQPQFSSTTTEHFLVGVGSILVGRNTASYRVWDAMRSIDYLASRPEVDGKRIGFTGCSGGGTLTSYVMALDDRVLCAAPACYVTTWRRLIETIGPQDAEQNIYGQVAFGMDHPDYLVMRAPKPTLISSTTGDFFDIRGSWDAYRQAKRVYARLGYPERVDLVEVEGKHGVQPQNLATIAHWMKRWLRGVDEPTPAIELQTLPPEQLLCTKSGQVLREFPDEKSVFDLNAQYEAELAKTRKQRWSAKSSQQMTAAVRETIGVREPGKPKTPAWKDLGRVQRDEYHIDKLVLNPNSRTPIPGLTYHPVAPHDAAYLYLHGGGKTADGAEGGAIEQLVNDGYAVVSIDLSGQGETATEKPHALYGRWKTYYLSYLLGKPLLGTRVEDALTGARFVAYYQKKHGEPRPVHLVGVGQAGIVALHAAAMQPELFASVTLRDTPRDWSSLVREPIPAGNLENAVHGALQVYDLPDLVRLVGKDKVRFED